MATPAHLGAAGAEFHAAVTDDFELSISERAALLQAAETVDVLAALEASIRETGAVVDGKANPLLVEARQQRNILVRLLGLLDLRDDEEEDSKASTSRSARAAARARWSKQRSA